MNELFGVNTGAAAASAKETRDCTDSGFFPTREARINGFLASFNQLTASSRRDGSGYERIGPFGLRPGWMAIESICCGRPAPGGRLGLFPGPDPIPSPTGQSDAARSPI